MTLNLFGIVVEEADNPQPACKASAIDQFWMAAGEVLIEIVSVNPTSNRSSTPRLMLAATSRLLRTIKATSHSP